MVPKNTIYFPPFTLYYFKTVLLTATILFLSNSIFSQVPIISSFNPAAGNAGSSVQIVGNNFNTSPANNTVYFGAVKATITTASTNLLIVKAPIAATYEPLTVTNNGLTALAKKPYNLLYGTGVASFTNSSFGSMAINGTYGSPNELCIVDFNDDDKPDMLTLGDGTSALSVFKNTSSGGNISFAAYQIVGYTGSYPMGFSVADIDGDGKKDIVVANGTDNDIVIFRNISAGNNISFASGVRFAAASNCANIAIGDVDNDGRPDIITTTNNSNSNIAILKNTSTQGILSFATSIVLPTNNYLQKLIISDIDGDQLADIIVISAGYPNNNINVLKNTTTTGVISFATAVSFATNGFLGNNYVDNVVTGDIDGDDKVDIVVTNNETQSISLLRNTGSTGIISFATKVDLVTDSNPVDINLSDLDGDGKVDILVGNKIGNTFNVFKNNSVPGSFSLLARANYSTDPYIYSTGIAGADFNGDSKPDIAIANAYTNGILIFKNNIPNINIQSFSPVSGIEGTIVTIKGTELSSINAVSFGGVPASTVTVLSDTTITAVVGKGNTGAVVLTSSGGTSVSLGGFTFLGPYINSFSPLSGNTGTSIIIKGINFNAATAVKFGSTPATSYTIVSDTVIIATVGIGSPGDITVTSTFGTANKQGFTYIPTPVITSFSPGNATIAEMVTIKGRYFTGATAVKLGSVAASSFTVLSDTVIMATTAATTSGNVSVTTSFGIATAAGFVFLQIPTITSFSPQSTFAGASIIILGAGFNSTPANNKVWFNGAAGIVTAAASNSLTVTVPPAAKNGALTVTVAGLTGYSQKQFVLSFGSGPLTTKSFVQKVDINPGTILDNILLIDLDGDGKPEAVSGGDSLIIQRNISSVNTISFATAKSFGPVGHYTVKIAAGDFDGDGKPDLTTITRLAFNNYFLSVYKNTSTVGNLSFTRLDFNSPDANGNMIVVDIDLDGKPDILLNGEGPSGYKSWVYRNITSSGNINFANPINLPFTVSDYNICAADLDGDGKTDIVNTTGPGNNLLLARNTSTPGSISFAAALSIVVGGYPTYCYTADIDGDGKQDIIFQNGDLRQFSILKNTSTVGNFSFISRTNYTSVVNHRRLAIADLDGDGKVDVAGLNGGGNNTVSLYKNISLPGTILLASEVAATSEYNMEDIDICDVDGDGKSDIGLMYNSFTVMRNLVKEPVIFSVTPQTAIAGSTITIKGYSFNGASAVKFSTIPATSFTVLSDTVIIAVLPIELAGNVSVTSSTGTGNLNHIYPTPRIISFSPAFAQPGDSVTIKGKYFSKDVTGNIVYFGATKAPVLSATDSLLKVKVPLGALYERITVTTHQLTATSIDLFNISFANGDTSFTAASFDTVVTISLDNYPQSLAIKDLDADGRPELSVFGYNYTTTLKNTSSNGLFSVSVISDSTPQYQCTVADIDGDGLFDKTTTVGAQAVTAAVYKNKSNNSVISFGRGTTIANTAPYIRSYCYQLPPVEDINGDGKPDIITGNNDDNSTNGSILVLLNKNTDSILSLIRKPGFLTGTEAGPLRTADLDGDGIPDVVTIHYSSGGFSILRNTSIEDNISFAARQDFATTSIPIFCTIGDVDGDGKKDILIANSTVNSFSIFRNTSVTGSISFAPKTDVATGNSSYSLSLAIADLNGDHKPDIVATNFTDSTVSVYKNNSVAGSIALSPRVNYKVGYAPQFVVIGDINMDGYPDIELVNANAVAILLNRQGKPVDKILCNPIGNTTLQTNIVANIYKWQLSVDSINFTNINDNINYSGTNTNTLNLNNIPSAWYGNQYRCVADAANGRIYSIQFSNTWTGANNNDWFTPSNWSCGAVPDANTDVVIKNGTVLLTASTTIRSLTMQPGAIFSISPGVILTILH